MTTQLVGAVLADRYELLDPLQGEPGAERYRALDRRLQREVVVELALGAGEPVPTATGVRTLAGADDLATTAVLDGGEVDGRHFVVRELPRGSFDETAVLHTGPTTAVFAVPPVLPVLPVDDAAPTDAPPPAARRGPSPGAWLLGLAAAVVAVVAIAAWAGDGDAPTSVDTDTTIAADPTSTVPAESRTEAVEATTPTTAAPPPTEAPTTTVPDVVSDPEETDQLPEGFPFDDGVPPGAADPAVG
jgi:hypothetical protein